MKACSIKSILALGANEQRVIGVVSGQLDGFGGVIDSLIWVIARLLYITVDTHH